MAGFSWATCEILMTNSNGGYGGTSHDLAKIPQDPDATMSFVHEYVHFLQLISSVAGLRLMGDLVRTGLVAAFKLNGMCDEVTGYHELLPLLGGLPDGAARNDSDVTAMAEELSDEATVLLGPWTCPLQAEAEAWDIVQQEVSHRTYNNTLYGIASPSGVFRPITPGMLAEGMARRIDQWVGTSEGFAGHAWPQSRVEEEFYCGIKNVLGREAYGRNVCGDLIDEITVIVCSLGLATPDPNTAVAEMLGLLRSSHLIGGTSGATAEALKELLVGKGLLRAFHYEQAMDQLASICRVVSRKEFYSFHEQFNKIAAAGNCLISRPGAYARRNVDWDAVRRWMEQHGLPPVIATDRSVDSIDGIACFDAVSPFLSEVLRVVPDIRLA